MKTPRKPSGDVGRAKRGNLGKWLLEDGTISEVQFDAAMAEVQRTGKSVGRILLELGTVSEARLMAVLAEISGYEFIDLADYPIDAMAAGVLPAGRYKAAVIGFDGDKLVVALSDPTNVIVIDDIRTLTGRDLRIVVATPGDVEQAIERIKAMDRSADALLEEVGAGQEEQALESLAAADEAPIVKAVNMLISNAVESRASDIHVEPQERELRIRYRIDGVLHEVSKQRKAVQAPMISRLKVMADLNIAEKRIPQDGRISLSVKKKPIDLRVATLPTVWGEKVVMRILDSGAALMDLEDLGFLESTLKIYRESFLKPYGAILVTGPTGSGKSTTLYSTLKIINTPDKNIITTEDPVEYRLPGITQIQVNPKAGLTFASALRSILRADPDVVMVGEMRDAETANIGIEAALTGHLVLSTLHTNDAPSAITRLMEMGVEPFLVASALDCVVAQRLARRLCLKCKEAYQPTPEIMQVNRIPMNGDGPPTLYRPVGCGNCAKTGYRGRLSLVEVMPITEEIERLTAEHKSSEDIKRVAVEQGMTTLRQDGIEKAVLGWTSLEEIFRVVV